MERKVFILGSNGYLGSALMERLPAIPGIQVKGLDRDASPPQLEEILEWSQICILANGLSNHIAGQKDPFLDFQTNAVEPLQILKHGKSKSFLFLGSLCQYGPLEGEVLENHPCEPVEPQGLSKLFMEGALGFLQRSGHLNFLSLRLGAVFGAKSSFENPSLLEKMVLSKVQGEIFPVYGGKERIWSGLSIEHFVDAVSRIIEENRFDGECFHFSTCAFPFSDLEPWLPLKFIESRNSPAYRINCQKFRDRYGWSFESISAGDIVRRLEFEIGQSKNI